MLVLILFLVPYQFFSAHSSQQFDTEFIQGIDPNFFNDYDNVDINYITDTVPLIVEDYSVGRSYPQSKLPVIQIRKEEVGYDFLGPLKKKPKKQISSRYDGSDVLDLKAFDMFDNTEEPVYSEEQYVTHDENYLKQKFNHLIDMSEARFRPRSFEEKLKMAIRQRALQEEEFHNNPVSLVSLLKELPRLRNMQDEKESNLELMKFSAKLTPLQMLSFRRSLKNSKNANDGNLYIEDSMLKNKLDDAIFMACMELSKTGKTPPECRIRNNSDNLDIERRVSRGDVDNIVEIFFCKIAIASKARLPRNCRKFDKSGSAKNQHSGGNWVIKRDPDDSDDEK